MIYSMGLKQDSMCSKGLYIIAQVSKDSCVTVQVSVWRKAKFDCAV